jgi:hypothetical protein
MMNERLKELAREAELLVYNPNGVPTKLEKFAELIVRECAEVGNSGDPLQDGEIARMIKQHFGVEE